MTRGTHFRAVMILVVMAAAALVAMLLSSVLLWPPKAASAQVSAPPNCATVPEGSIAAWWPWEGNGNDIKSGNTANLLGNPAFVAGKVGQTLSFDGVDDHAKALASSSLDVGAGDGLTIEAWIKPGSNRDAPLVEWNNGTISGVGTHLWIFSSGRLYANLKDTNGVDYTMTGEYIGTAYQHVALTFDKASGYARLYRNGAFVGGRNLPPGSVTPQTTYDLYFGKRPANGFQTYLGQLEEPGIFDRALTQQQIQGIYNAGNTSSPVSKCPDDTASPSSTASATTTDDGNPYASDALTKSDVSVNLSAEDATGGWGVKEITYSATGGQPIPQQTVLGSSATLPTITQEGVTTVTYYATDKAGNAETQKTFKVNIDKSAPLVRSVSPVKAATNVILDTVPSATFWEQMKPETFTTANVKMFDLSTKKRVPVKLGCDEPCTTVTIDPYPSDPSKLLGKRTKYKVVILGGAGGPQNMVGMPLEASYVWTFTTGRR